LFHYVLQAAVTTRPGKARKERSRAEGELVLPHREPYQTVEDRESDSHQIDTTIHQNFVSDSAGTKEINSVIAM
jgi:hypothetical protein